MAPRQPPESSDDEQIKHLQALQESTAIDKLPIADIKQDAPHLVTAEEVEFDRMEAYLRGPTAFTA